MSRYSLKNKRTKRIKKHNSTKRNKGKYTRKYTTSYKHNTRSYKKKRRNKSGGFRPFMNLFNNKPNNSAYLNSSIKPKQKGFFGIGNIFKGNNNNNNNNVKKEKLIDCKKCKIECNISNSSNNTLSNNTLSNKTSSNKTTLNKTTLNQN